MAVTRSRAREFAKDRLSALPDDVILNYIFPWISYRDVVRSSSLSQRWRFLWRKTTIVQFCPEDFERQNDDRIHAIINDALLRVDGRLRRLKIDVGLVNPRFADLNNWIHLAAQKQVSRIVVKIGYRDSNTKLRGSIHYLTTLAVPEIGDSIWRCTDLTNLKVAFVKFPKVPNNVGVFRSLTSFHCLSVMTLDDAKLQGFINLCPHLRNLSIYRCFEVRRLYIRSSKLMYLRLGCMNPNFSMQIACPKLTEINLTDWKPFIALRSLHQVSIRGSVKIIRLLNYNASDAVNPAGIPSITLLNTFVALQQLVIHGICFQEMISDDISVAEVKLPNLKMVRAHIGAEKATQALNFLDFLLRNAPSSVVSIFFHGACPQIVEKRLSEMKNEFSKSRLITAPRNESTEWKRAACLSTEWKRAACLLCDQLTEY